MKISIALFTTLIAASHHLLASAADAAADGATSRSHLRALVDAAVDVACSGDRCNNDSNCDIAYQCQIVSGCNGRCVEIPCNKEYHCNAAGNGCPAGATCDTGFPAGDGCYVCLIRGNGDEEADAIQNDEDGSEREATSLRASILEEE